MLFVCCHCCSVTQSCLTLCDPMEYARRSLPEFMSIASVMPSSHLILWLPLLLLYEYLYTYIYIYIYFLLIYLSQVNWDVIYTPLPRWQSGKESICQCRRCEFNLWVGKIPPEEEMATCSSILARIILWTEEPGGLRSHKESDLTEQQIVHAVTDDVSMFACAD